MTTAEGYRRAAYTLRGNRPLTDQDAAAMIGHEISISVGDKVLSSGTVTDCRVVDGGERFKLTVENNGRACVVCGHVYTEGEAAAALAQIDDVKIARPGRVNLPGWVQVCADLDACKQRWPVR